MLIIDTTGKQSTWASLPFSVNIAQPTISFTAPTASSTQSGVFTVKAFGSVASGSTAEIRDVCFKLDGNYRDSGQITSANSQWWYTTLAVSGFGTCFRAANSQSYGRVRQSGEFAWLIDATVLTNGAHTLEVLIIDTTGKQSTWASLNVTVNNPMPTISIVSPMSGQRVIGEAVVTVVIGSSLGAVFVGIDAPNASPSGYSEQVQISNANVPAGSQFWNAGSAKTFTWKIDTSSWKTGQRIIAVSVVDRASQLVTSQLTVDVQSAKPTVSITTPSDAQIVKGKFTFAALFSSPAEAGRSIRYLGISENSAVPQFNADSGYSDQLSGKFKVTGIPRESSNSALRASWTVDFSKSAPGPYSVTIAAVDNRGDKTEQTIRFTIAKPEPVVKILSPVSDQTINGAISLKVNATADPATTSKISFIAISSTLFTPQFLGRSTNSCQLDSKYVCLSVEDLKDYSWTSPISGWKDGDYTLTVIAIDESGNTGTQSVNFKVSSVAPTVTITSPSAGVISKSSFKVAASAIANTSSGAEIIAVAISDRSATPQFPGSLYGRQVVGLPSDAAIWQVANVKNPIWLLDPSNWSEGDRVINVFAIDSNGKLGQSSITVHVAPEPTWRIDVQGSPVLGKSVPVLVTMTTNIPRRSNPPVVIVLQTSSTSAGPWTDLGQITLDSSGTGSGNVLVSKDFYVRVNHPNLDAVQSGTSAAKRIVSVPDPSRPGGNIGTGEPNEDGSIPRVICTVPPKAKSGAKLAFSCVAENVQDSSQGVSILQQTGSGNKKIGNATIRGSRITGSITIKAKGNITFRLRGADGKYVPWTSSPFTVKYN